MSKSSGNSKNSDGLTQKTPVKRKGKVKLNKIDKAALMLTRENPEMTNHEIGKQVAGLGIIKHPSSIYKRLKRSDYLARDIAEIRQHHRETLSRELVPLAIKNTKKALKSDDIADSIKLGYTKMVMDKEFGEDRGPTVNMDKVQIAQLQVYQTLVHQNLQGADQSIEPADYIELEEPESK